MRKPGRRQMEALHREALIMDSHHGLPRECPDGSGRTAPDGQHWMQSMMGERPWVLEADGTPYTLSVASETYWSS